MKSQRQTRQIKTMLAFSMFSILTAGQTYAEESSLYDDANTYAWGDIEYKDDPWVFNASRPYFITEGLQNRHLALWASHGRYYDADKGRWKWQRPNLYCTNEDLFTQTIVVPFLIPMLENAGANVFTPRERDWQPNEVVIDNDDAQKTPYYIEIPTSKKWRDCDSVGFGAHKETYHDGENPFSSGTIRQAKTTKRQNYSEISYQPNLPEAGRYAVYVSYKTLPKSVPDAKYIVYHKGQRTEFTVNQRMGGGTWVYLGTFDFDKGCSPFNRVVATNHSSKRGVVTTDAVRFGGGMGNIVRGASTSGLPRCLEGARYYAQWAGAPYAVYGGRNGENDYADDINCRSLMTNWLGGGSVYMPTREGLHVPLELSLAIHSDAGFTRDGKTTTGSLAVCTTDFNDGMFGSGVTRQTSKDFARALLDNTVRDIQAKYGAFNKRYLWDRNYSETRLPDIPSAILETLSHQNFADMRLAQDPTFKFTLARSIYKTILRYVSTNHGRSYTVQPLPPNEFSVEIDGEGMATLKWSEQTDASEPTATPTAYIVYTAEGKGGFDNGQKTAIACCRKRLEPGKTYSFKVSAINAGGESFPSETLAAQYSPQAKASVLIVNNFHRLASPQVVDNATQQGFDIELDPGVSYGITAGWAGKQLVFDRNKMGMETSAGLGYCESEMAGTFVAGNDFNYTVEHARGIPHKYNVASCSVEAILSGRIRMEDYQTVDLINGLEKNDGYTPEYYKAFSPTLQEKLKDYTSHGGALLVSGSYTLADMQTPEEKAFLRNVLKIEAPQPTTLDQALLDSIDQQTADSLLQLKRDSLIPSETVHGLGMQFDFYKSLCSKHYAATHPETIMPTEGAISAMQYSSGACAAVGYKGTDYHSFTMGFPLECIKDERTRASILTGIIGYLLK